MKETAFLPGWVRRLLTWMVPVETRDGALMDFREAFGDYAARSRAKAWGWMAWQLVLMAPPSLYDHGIRSMAMLKNYFVLALRHMRRQRLFTLINMFCLSVGLAACVLVLLYVQYEFSFDRFHPHAERIYRVDSEVFMRSRWKGFNVVPSSVGPAMAQNLPEVEEAVRFQWAGQLLFQAGDRRHVERDLILTDPSVFSLFSFRAKRGSLQNALQGPDEIVITEAISRKYFGDSDPVGQTLVWIDPEDQVSKPFKVVAELADLPPNTYIRFGMLASRPQAGAGGFSVDEDEIGSNETFVRLSPQVDPSAFEAKLERFKTHCYPPEMAQKRRLRLVPLLSLHSGYSAEGSMKFFSMMAVVVLAIAVFNFVNLSLARSLKRHREVGTRKVLGATRRQLFCQFVGEALFFSVGGFFLGLLLVLAALPFVNAQLGLPLSPAGFFNGRFFLAALLLTGLTGLVSGGYPAAVLSCRRPISVLRGERVPQGRATFALSQMLVILQFAVSSFFIATAWARADQLDYMLHKDWGMDLDGRVSVTLEAPMALSRLLPLRDALQQQPEVESVSLATFIPTGNEGLEYVYPTPLDGTSSFQALVKGDYLHIIYSDASFVRALGLRLREGKAWAPDAGQGSEPTVILNRLAQRAFDPEVQAEPGSVVRYHTGDDRMRTVRVAGVVDDFHLMTLRLPMHPLVLTTEPAPVGVPYRYLILQLREGLGRSPLMAIQAVLQKQLPDCPAKVTFMEDEFRATCADHEGARRLGMAVALLTVLISSLGLYGLAAFTLERRTRELGIRKVLGARSWQLLWVMVPRFLAWIVLANALAMPLALIWQRGFLRQFAYRASITGLNLLGALGLTLAVLVVSMGYKFFSTARVNPVQSLNQE